MSDQQTADWPPGIIAQLRAIDENAMRALPHSVKAIVTKAADDIERLWRAMVIDDAMVERAYDAMIDAAYGSGRPEPQCSPREAVRAALAAALSR
jgi:hypothetical protein